MTKIFMPLIAMALINISFASQAELQPVPSVENGFMNVNGRVENTYVGTPKIKIWHENGRAYWLGAEKEVEAVTTITTQELKVNQAAPTRPAPTPAVINLNVQFNLGKADLLKNSLKDIDQLANVLTQNPEIKVEIQGHTDNTGSTQLNRDLSEKRASAIANYLAQFHQISSDRLSVVGYGADLPIASNDTEAGRKSNRRVQAQIK
jgi:outer membrane protein OmpA-like peptidoglycan-associated protein